MPVVRLKQNEVSDWLRKLADQFERGEATSLACVARLEDGGMLSVQSESHDVFDLLSAAAYLQHAIVKSIESTVE